MRMHLLSGGRLLMPRAVYYPDAEPGDWFEIPVSCALFRHTQGVALFDTGCNALFHRATVICQARELAAARAEDSETQGFLRREWDVGTAIQAIDGEHDVFGDGRLTLTPLPGHTPGSMGAHAVLDRSGSFLLASDAAPVAASLAGRTVPKNTWDPVLYLGSLDEIARHADDGATILFGHDDAQWRSVRTGALHYD